jgi:DNA-binding protein H-NS
VVSSPAKYRGPEGQQWTGKGTAPRWLNDLVAGGKTREDFLIRNEDAAASGSAAAE